MSRDTRYGRRGGGWAETRTGADVCRLCRNSTARWEATHRHRNEQWTLCGTCKAQTERHRIPADLTPIEDYTGFQPASPEPQGEGGGELSIWDEGRAA